MKDKDLQKLVVEAKRGKQAAFTALYEQTRDRAYFVACRLVSGNDVADMLQESYTAAFSAIDTFDTSKEFEPWLHTIVCNKCINHLKKKQDLLTVDNEDGIETEDTEALVPSEWLEQREKREKILEIIDRLPEYQRVAVVLFYYEGHSVAEIAEILSIPEGTVKSRLSNARKTIKGEVLLEEQRGNKLYGVAGVPILTKIFQREEAAARIPAEISEQVLQGTLSALSSSGAVAGGAGIVAKFMALSAGAKAVIVSAAAVVVVAGVGVPVYMSNQPQEPAQPVMAVVDDVSSTDGVSPVDEAYTASESEQATSSESVASSEVAESAPVVSEPESETAAVSSEPVSEAPVSSEAQSTQEQTQTPTEGTQQQQPSGGSTHAPGPGVKDGVEGNYMPDGSFVPLPQVEDISQEEFDRLFAEQHGGAKDDAEWGNMPVDEQNEIIANRNWAY